jgi:hypothetical protein
MTSWRWDDYDDGAVFSEDRKESLRAAAREYLGTHGDTVDARVVRCLGEAAALLESGHTGPALSVTATGIELMIRFMVLRPLLIGVFLFDEWADILVDRVIKVRVEEDRKFLPDVLRRVEIEIGDLRTSTGVAVWDFLQSHFWPERDRFIHRGDFPPPKTAIVGLECAQLFRADVIGRIARTLDFTLEETDKWSEIHGVKEVGIGDSRILNRTFRTRDPLSS